jgi:hypothetical protein
VFGLGAALAGFAGVMRATILTVQIGMGENILILAFVASSAASTAPTLQNRHDTENFGGCLKCRRYFGYR